ncbi:ribonuclease HI [uncultured Mitsuokella sp.]|uniref:ribonuclease HI n=1 Tax=uncultured Mitsuokella sp. TaxID=453120 RepID=UPI00260BCAAC|nr:RNase H family protein [uncultured Mitsuokella sp.]
MIYVVYGESVPNGYQLYDSFEQVMRKHPELPAPGVSVRKFSDTTTVDEIVEMTNGSTMEEKLNHLGRALSSFQKARKIITSPDVPAPKQRLYVVYGQNVLGGYQLYDSFEQAHQAHNKLPVPGKLIRKFAADVTFDAIVDATKDSTQEKYGQHLYEELSAFRERHGIEAPPNDCQRYLVASSADDASLPASEEAEEESEEETGTPSTSPKILMESVMLCLPQVITCYIDGSCLENYYGGFSAIFLDGGRPLAFVTGAAFVESSLEAEWHAARLAFRALDTAHHQLYLYSDCDDVVSILNGKVMNGHRTPAIRKLYREIRQLAKPQDVIISHIKGHAGVTWNEFADTLARQKADAFRMAVLTHSIRPPQKEVPPSVKEEQSLLLKEDARSLRRVLSSRRARHPDAQVIQQTLPFSFDD